MGAVAQLSSTSVLIEPGREATMAIQVRNTGTVVDRFSFEALGAAGAWVTFSPDTLSLFPQATGSVNIVIAAPREPGTSAGEIPLGIKVVSSEDAEGSVVEETTLQVAAFSDVGIELVPKITRGRRRGRTQLAIDNRSNCPYRADLEASDTRGVLAFSFAPPAVDVKPGEAEFIKVGIRPRKVFWRGPSQTLPFAVALRAGAPDGGQPALPHPAELQADGSMVQDALLPRWLLAALAALVALILLFVLLWYTLFKPQIRSTAKDAAKQQLAAAGITPAAPAPSGGGSKPSGGGGGGAPGPTTVPPGGTSSVVSNGQSVNGSAQGSGNATQVVYTVPAGRSLNVTDLLVENSAGDTGTLTLSRNGVPLMQWALANFRDLDYHWITPTVFGPGTQMQMVVSGCPNACTPGMYYAGNLVSAS